MKNQNNHALKKHLDLLSNSSPLNECKTCECFQGFVTQLEIDDGNKNEDLIKSLKVPEKNLHSCLGCSPCPAANLYTKYLINKKKHDK